MNESEQQPKQATLVKDISWDELESETKEGGSNKYFTPELNTRYDIVIASAKPVEKTFAGNSKPTKMLEMQLSSVNGQPSTQVWSSGSWKVMKEVVHHHKAGTLATTKFLMRKTMQNGKQEYTFEAIGPVVGASAPAPSGGI